MYRSSMSRIQKDTGLQVYVARKCKCFTRADGWMWGSACVYAWVCIRGSVCVRVCVCRWAAHLSAL